MKAALFGVLFALLTFLVVVLLLNRREGGPDVYYGGSLAPVQADPSGDPMLWRLIPLELTHACPSCDRCTHPVEIVETRRTLSIRDRRRWFQLFHWSDRIYYFDDLVQFAGGYRNRSAGDQKGSWSIQARLGPAKHDRKAPHDCSLVPTGFTVNYELVASLAPLEETTRDLASQAILADRVQALAFRYETPSPPTVLYFVWQLAPGAGVAPPAPCPCGKP